MRLAVGAAVTHGEVGCAGRHVVDAMEVVHAVAIGNVALAAQDIDDGHLDLL